MTLSDIPNGKSLAKTFFIDDNDRYTINQRIALLNINSEYDAKYINYLLSRNKYFLRYDDGVNQTNLSKSDVLSFQYQYPSLKLQFKTSHFLSQIDNLIIKQNVRINRTNQIKSGTIPMLFNTGRFYKLEDLGYFTKGNGLSKLDLVPDGVNSCILYGELFTTYNEVIEKVVSRTNSNGKTISKGSEVLLPASTTTGGREIAIASALNMSDVILGSDINIFSTNNIVDNRYLSYYLTHIKWKDIAKCAVGITIIHLYGKDLLQIKIQIPDDHIQLKIINFLSQMDNFTYMYCIICKTTNVIYFSQLYLLLLHILC